MLKSEFQSTADKIDNQRPFKVAVAISAHERDSRTDSAKFIQNPFCTNVSKVPDLICILRHLADVFRQTIMRISQNKNPCRFFLFRVFHFKPKSVLKRSRTSRGIEDKTGYT